MTIDTKSITQHVMFWLLIAFIAGFGFSEILTRAGVNPLRSSANMAAPDTVYCANWMFADPGIDPYYHCNPEIRYTEGGGYGEVTGYSINPPNTGGNGGQGSGVRFIEPTDGGGYEGGPTDVQP